MKDAYQLRKAAGSYWLLSMNQSGKEYIEPVLLNETGARIWREIQEGKTVEEIAGAFEAEFKIPRQEAGEDVRQFLEQLKARGISPQPDREA